MAMQIKGGERAAGVNEARVAEPPNGPRRPSLYGFEKFCRNIDDTGWSESLGASFAPLRNEPGDAVSACTRPIHEGAGPIKGTIYLAIDGSFKGPGTAGDAELIEEFKSALDKTDFGKHFDVRLVTGNAVENAARNSGRMNAPPNMTVVIQGDAGATNALWNEVKGRKEYPFSSFGLAPGPFAQPVSVGKMASRAEYSDPRLTALVACHELGHRLFDMADGSQSDSFGGWGDFPYEATSDGISGTYNLMTAGTPMLERLNELKVGGQYKIPEEFYKMPSAFLEGIASHPGIKAYLDGLPTR